MNDRISDRERGDPAAVRDQVARDRAAARDPGPFLLARASPTATPASTPGPTPEATPVVRRDLVLLTSDETVQAVDAALQSGDVVAVYSLDQMLQELQNFDAPIGTLTIVSHSSAEADIMFRRGNRSRSIPASKVAERLQGILPPGSAPRTIEFRGCSIGKSPQGMNRIRQALGARSVVGSTCFMVKKIAGPVSVNEQPITNPAQVTEANRADFERALDLLRESFGGARGCIVNDSEAGYFAAGGYFLAVWVNPDVDLTWDEGGRNQCLSDIREEQGDPTQGPVFEVVTDCKMVRVNAP